LQHLNTINDGLGEQKPTADGVITLANQQVHQLVAHWIKGSFLDFCGG